MVIISGYALFKFVSRTRSRFPAFSFLVLSDLLSEPLSVFRGSKSHLVA